MPVRPLQGVQRKALSRNAVAPRRACEMIEEIRRGGPRFTEVPAALPPGKRMIEDFFRQLKISEHGTADKKYIEPQTL